MREKRMTVFTRRRIIATMAGGAAASVGLKPEAAFAQAYPNAPVKFISPYAAGGATDTIARLVGQWLQDKLGGSFIVENRPGGGANIGTESVLKSPADGHTMLLASTANAVNATLFQNLKFNFLQDSIPVASIGTLPNIFVVQSTNAIKTMPEFIAAVKANPGKVTIGLPGNGSPQHLSAELFKLQTSTEPLFVQYRGGSTVSNDLLGGHVQSGVASTVSVAELVKSGQLRALAVTSAKRNEAFPEVPAMAETLPGFEAVNFYGISMPKGVPDPIVVAINKEVNAALANAEFQQKLAVLGISPNPMTSAAFGSLIASETEKWAKVIKAGNIKPQ
jgi:tripartite-type tricarboxylate transporter receptor subunit TctC